MSSGFVGQKQKALSEYKAALHAGDVDAELISLLDKINSLSDYYTTSSCAGRIVLLSDAGSKRESVSLAKWHGTVTQQLVLDALKPSFGVTYFKYEPAIIHVAARDIDCADRMQKTAYACGFKRSGIQSIKAGRVLIEVLGTQRLEIPIAREDDVLIDEKYVSFIVNLANKKY